MLKLQAAIGTRSYVILESIVCRSMTNISLIKSLRYAGKIDPAHLSYLLSEMVVKNVAAYEPLAQTRSVLLFWRLPGEWAEVLHAWVRCTLTCTLSEYIFYPVLFDWLVDYIFPTGNINCATEHNPNFLRDYRPASEVSVDRHPFTTSPTGDNSTQ